MTSLFDLPPRIALDFTSLDGDTVTITRADAAGNTAPVRSANPTPLSGGEWIGYDYECPFGIEVWYTAVTNTGHTETAGPLSLSVQQCWLIHPGLPLLSRRVSVVTIGDRTTSSTQGVYRILGRANPIVISDGSRQGSTFDMILKTDTFTDAADLRTLLADSSPLLLQVAYPSTELRDYLWVSIGDVVESKVMPTNYGDPLRRWTLPCTVVDPPSGQLQATWTWQDVVDGYATWQDVVDAFDTWRAVVTDTPAG